MRWKCIWGDKMNNEIVGINEIKLDAFILEINEIANRINEKLNFIEDNISETKLYFKCEQADELRRKFELLSSCFPNVKNNISCIADDLISVKRNMNNANAETISSISIKKNQISSK